MAEKVKREFFVERHAVTSVVLYEVTGEDLEQLEKETLTVGEDFSFALAALSIAASFTVALTTVTIPPGKTNEVFWIVMLFGYVAGLFFGIRWVRGRNQFRGVMQKIRSRGGPLGEEGKEAATTTTTVTTVAASIETTKAE